MNPPFSPYEYFSYFFPGATVLGMVYVAARGFPAHEPGAVATLAVVGIAFVTGHMVAAVAAWAEPVLWGHRPGSRADSTWGMFGERGTYPEGQRAEISADLAGRYGSGSGSFRAMYDLAYTELQQVGKDGQLKIMNQQIGFYRNMSAACLVAMLISLVTGVVVAQVSWLVWAGFFAAATILFAYRYRRFWRYFGDNVLRGVRALKAEAK